VQATTITSGWRSMISAVLTTTTGRNTQQHIQEKLIAVAKEQHPHISFQVGNFLNLQFGDAIFDGVWAHQSLLHLETVEDVSKALAEFYRVLKPSGVMLVQVKAMTTKNKTAVVTDAFSGHDRFFQYFTKPEVTELLTKAGFTIESIEQFRESDRNPNGRPEVELILALTHK